MDRLRAMQIFVRVAERGNFTRAAEESGLSHGMASAIVNDLERHLGVQLIRRTTRRLQLTDDGLRYLERARLILSELTELEEEIGGGETSVRGSLRVQVPSGFSRLVLAPAIGRFLERHPDLSMIVLSRNSYPDFVGDNLDAAIYIGEIRPEDGLISRPLGRIPLLVQAAPDYWARHGEPKTPDDLDAHNCYGIWSQAAGRALDWRFEHKGQFITKRVGGNLVFEASEPAVRAAAEGGGVLQMISFLVKDEISAGQLRPVLLDWLYPGPTIHYLYKRHRRVPRKLRVFEAFLRELYQAELKPFDARFVRAGTMA